MELKRSGSQPSPEVSVRIGERQIGAIARVLDRETDRALCDEVAALANRKYGWGDGLPVEITPLTARPARSEASVVSGH